MAVAFAIEIVRLPRRLASCNPFFSASAPPIPGQG